MSLPEAVMLGVILFIGVPSMWRNPTAIALVASWLLGVLIWKATGEAVPMTVDILRDYSVVIVIFLKGEFMDCSPLGGLWAQFSSCWRARSNCDKAILLLFVPMWSTYAVTMEPYYAYWIAWTVGLLQFLAAGGEAFETWRREPARTKKDSPPPDISLSRLGLVGREC